MTDPTEGNPGAPTGVRPIMRTTVVLLLLATAALVSACGGGVATDSPAGREFVATTVTGHELVDGTTLSIAFGDDGRLRAGAGCNTLGGTWTLTDGRLQVGPLETTEMGCPGDLDAQDEWLADLLAAEPTASLDGDTLTLATDTSTVELLDRDVAVPDLPLEGTRWEVDTLVDGDSASSSATQAQATPPAWLRLDGDGGLEGFDGCLPIEGTAIVTGQGVDLEPDPPTATLDCPAQQTADAVRGVLTTGVQWSVDGEVLTLDAPTGEGLRLRAAEG